MQAWVALKTTGLKTDLNPKLKRLVSPARTKESAFKPQDLCARYWSRNAGAVASKLHDTLASQFQKQFCRVSPDKNHPPRCVLAHAMRRYIKKVCAHKMSHG